MIKNIVENNKNYDIQQEKIKKLKELFPNCFDANGEIKFEMIKEELSSNIKFSKESFDLNFLGKSYAKMLAGIETETVLCPDEEHNSEKQNKDSENIYISGDNLDALKHLVKSYEDAIKCIYIDPPYNTGSDGFVYADKFNYDKETLVEKLDVDPTEAERIINMTSSSSSSHSAWLTFMYPRLYLAKNLLADNGAIFISIGDDEVNNLKLLCDTIFGEENFVALCPRKTRGSATTKSNAELQKLNDYVLIYLKDKENSVFNLKINGKKEYPYTDDRGKYYTVALQDNGPSGTRTARPNLYYPIYEDKEGILHLTKDKEDYVEYLPDKHKNDDGRWMWSKEKFSKDYMDLCIQDDKVCIKHYYNPAEDQNKYEQERNWLDKYQNAKGTTTLNEVFGIKGLFSNPKPIELIEFLINLISDKNSIILDFFGGSASTAHAVMNLNKVDGGNRKFILVQLPESLEENYERAEKEAKKMIEAQMNYLKSINRPLYLDEIGKQRMILVGKQYSDGKSDPLYGFKHYTISDTPNDLLSKMEDFNPNLINDCESIFKEYGLNTIIETWKIDDGYGFNEKVLNVDLDGYECYKVKDTLYFINPNISIQNISSLLSKYKDDEFNCDKIVLFGYSFNFEELEMIKNNIKQVKTFKNIDVKVYTRY